MAVLIFMVQFLPKYRGAAPIQRAIIAGEKTTGASSVIKVDQGLDTGDIVLDATTRNF